MCEYLSKYRNTSVRVNPGKYRIGPPDKEVEIALDTFYVSKFLVTNADYVLFLNTVHMENHVGGVYRWLNDVNSNMPIQAADEGYLVDDSYAQHPVVGVTWYGAVLFSMFLGGRLLTESEWEVSNRCGDSNNQYPWGSTDPTPELCNYGNNIGSTTSVGQYPPNEWGLYDMAGNVREWCADIYHPNTPYLIELDSCANNHTMRVVKGGAWNKPPSYLPAWVRRGKWLRMGSDSCGFRIAFSNT